ARGQTAVEIIDLRHDADAPLHRNWIASYIEAFNTSRAAGGKNSSRKNADRRCLAGAVWTEQAEEFATRNFKGNALEGLDLDTFARLRLVGLSQILDCDYCFHKALFGSATSSSFWKGWGEGLVTRASFSSYPPAAAGLRTKE